LTIDDLRIDGLIVGLHPLDRLKALPLDRLNGIATRSSERHRDSIRLKASRLVNLPLESDNQSVNS
jgi:hypothetical protein